MNAKPMQKRRYTLTRGNIVACLIMVAGIIFCLQGVICRYRLDYVENSYTTSEIKNGRYIECDISKEQVMRQSYSELNGATENAPYSDTDVFTGVQTYIVATNENLDCYVPITVPREYQDGFESMINDEDIKFHLFGKFKRYTKFNDIFGDALTDDTMADYFGVDEEEVKNIISENHKIVLVDPVAERSIIYKGISLIFLGFIILYSSEHTVKRETDYSYVRRKMASIEKSKRDD